MMFPTTVMKARKPSTMARLILLRVLEASWVCVKRKTSLTDHGRNFLVELVLHGEVLDGEGLVPLEDGHGHVA